MVLPFAVSLALHCAHEALLVYELRARFHLCAARFRRRRSNQSARKYLAGLVAFKSAAYPCIQYNPASVQTSLAHACCAERELALGLHPRGSERTAMASIFFRRSSLSFCASVIA